MSVDVKYLTTATATGGRDGKARPDDRSFEVRLSTPRELCGAGGEGNNPKQLFAAGYATCFIGAMNAVAGQVGVRVPAEASVTSAVGSAASLAAIRAGDPLIPLSKFPKPPLRTPATRQ